MKFQCEHCEKSFVKEKTLASHSCESKRRWQDRNTVPVQLALQAYQKFYQQCQPSQRLKTWKQFAESSYYTAFVKFARYMIDVKCVNTSAFIDWVIRKNVKLDQWASDRTYEQFLMEWSLNEPMWDAVQRSLISAADWSEQNNSVPGHYFRYATDSRIINDIIKGRISAWVVLVSDSGKSWLERLLPGQLDMIFIWINPDKWGEKIQSENQLPQLQTLLIELGM
jgi:hypothetical protein